MTFEEWVDMAREIGDVSGIRFHYNADTNIVTPLCPYKTLELCERAWPKPDCILTVDTKGNIQCQ